MSGGRPDEEECPLLAHQACGCPCVSDHGGEVGGTIKSAWVRFRQPSPIWVVCIFAIYEFIFGILLVPEFNATFALICHQRYSEHRSPGYSNEKPNLLAELDKCLRNENAQSAQSQFLSYGQVTAGLFGAISNPILGSLSDRVGRKPILACAVIGPLMHESLILSLLWYPDSLDMRWLLVGYAMEGLSGSMIAAVSTSQAYITDIAHPSDRARLFSYLMAAISFACATGPIVAGGLLEMLKSLDLIYRFVVCAHLLLALTFLFVLPESRWARHSEIAERDGSIRDDSPKESYVLVVLKSAKSLWSSSAFRQKSMFLLALMDSAIFGIMMGLPPLQLAYPAFLFGWQPTAQSFYVSLYYWWSILVLVALFPIIRGRVYRWTRRITITNMPAVFNVGDMGAVQMSLMLQMMGYIGIAFVRIPSLFVILSLVIASGAPIAPLLTSCLTAHVPRNQSGKLLGMLSFLHSIARIVIPAALDFTYSMTIGIYPAPLFTLLAIISGALLLASMYIKTNAM